MLLVVSFSRETTRSSKGPGSSEISLALASMQGKVLKGDGLGASSRARMTRGSVPTGHLQQDFLFRDSKILRSARSETLSGTGFQAEVQEK